MKKNSTVSVSFMLMGILFCVCLVASNLLGTKILQVGPFPLTAGVIVFPVSYILNDCILGDNKSITDQESQVEIRVVSDDFFC